MTKKEFETRKEEINLLLDQATELTSNLHSDCQEYFDDKSEKWQESEKGETMQEQIDLVIEAEDTIDEANDSVKELEWGI